VLADAISTPLQRMRRCGLAKGEVRWSFGAGGVGGYAVQIAKALGAFVVALDIDPKKLERASALGANLALDSRTAPKELKKAIGVAAKAGGARPDAWRIFEMSGSKAGQELAFGLLTRAGPTRIVGYTRRRRRGVSNLMASTPPSWGKLGL